MNKPWNSISRSCGLLGPGSALSSITGGGSDMCKPDEGKAVARALESSLVPCAPRPLSVLLLPDARSVLCTLG